MRRNPTSATVRPNDPVDAAFLRRVARTDRRRARAGVAGRLARGGERVGRWLRAWSRRAAGLVLALVVAGGLVVAGSPANARDINANDGCDRKVFAPERADGGLIGDLLEAEYVDKVNRGDIPKTKWAQYGVAGTYWPTFWLDCYSEARGLSIAGNQLFSVSRNLSAVAIFIFMWSFKGAVLDVFLADDPGVVGTQATLDNMIERVHIDVYLQLVAVATLIGATVIAWKWLASRESASEVFSKFGWMVVIAGLAGVYGGVPGGPGPQASAVLKTLNDWTNGVTIVVLAAFTSTDCETPTIVYEERAAQNEAGTRRIRDLTLECVAERMYEVMIYTPWAIGMLGHYDLAPRGADGKRGEPTTDEALAERMLKQQAYSFTDIARNAEDPRHYTDRRATDLDDTIGLLNEINQDICKDVPVENRPEHSYSGKLCDRAEMRQQVFGISDKALEDWEEDYASAVPDPEVASNPNYWYYWSGGRGQERFSVGLTALLGSASIAIIVIILSIAYLILEVGGIMFALMAPLAFLVGLIPGFGVRVFLRWLELLLSTFLKRIVLGLFVGLLMALYSVVFTISMPWVMRLVIAAVVCLIGFVYRSKFSDAFALNFSDGQKVQLDGELDGKVPAGLRTGAQFTARRVMRTGAWAWRTVRGG